MTDVTGRRMEAEGFTVSHMCENAAGLECVDALGVRREGGLGRGSGRLAGRPLPEDVAGPAVHDLGGAETAWTCPTELDEDKVRPRGANPEP